MALNSDKSEIFGLGIPISQWLWAHRKSSTLSGVMTLKPASGYAFEYEKIHKIAKYYNIFQINSLNIIINFKFTQTKNTKKSEKS